MNQPTPGRGPANDRPALLFLCHRIPYPPDKGDKIRSFHLLKHLSERHRVYLGAFIDDPADRAHIPYVRSLCEEACLLPLSPGRARLRSLRGLVTGEPLSLPYYADARMRRWVEAVSSRADINRVLVFSSQMGQYVLARPLGRTVVDFVDVDSDKWAQYAKSKPAWSAWVYHREAVRLGRFEELLAGHAAASVFVSEAEAGLFRDRAESSWQVVGISNGVDTGYFRPDADLPNPYPAGEQPIVFTGAMDYWANVDAVKWFAGAVMPSIARRREQAKFYIVGSRPAPEVLALRSDRVAVTGRVEDVRPYLQHANVAVAPLRIARGIQNKVLEGMAMAKTVVTTSKGLEGLAAEPDRQILVADAPEEFAAAVCRVLTGEGSCSLGAAARDLVVNRYGWDAAIRKFEALLDDRPDQPDRPDTGGSSSTFRD